MQLPISKTLEDVQDVTRARRPSQPFAELLVIEQPRNLCEEFDMVSPACFGAKDNKKQVDFFAIESGEVHAGAHTVKPRDQTVDTIGVRVRYRYPVTNACAHDLFAFEDVVQRTIIVVDQLF